MSLLNFQTALGNALRGPSGTSAMPKLYAEGFALSPMELMRFRQVVSSPGFEFTVAVKRSWSEGRAANAARETLSFVPADERRALLSEWVAVGGGTKSFVSSEADAFLEFIARRLPNPSHLLTLCRLEQAVNRAGSSVASFEPRRHSTLHRGDILRRADKRAALVRFFVEPDDLLAALQRAESLPPRSKPTCHLLFAPAIPDLCRRASDQEVRLWERLAHPVQIGSHANAGCLRDAIESLARVGAIDISIAGASCNENVHAYPVRRPYMCNE